MPAGNQTGPSGMGPRTGRGMGYCSGYNAPGYANQIAGMGFGRGGYGRGQGGRCWNRGFGFRNRAYPNNFDNYQPYQFDAKQEKNYLLNQVDVLKNQINQLNTRITDLQKMEDLPDKNTA